MPEIFINIITVPEGREEETLEAWRAISDLMEASEHCLSTKLHQHRKNPRLLVNYAIHPSMEAFLEISRSPEFIALSARLTELGVERVPGVYDIIHGFGVSP
jgi:quinol monooxygenase YgiN